MDLEILVIDDQFGRDAAMQRMLRSSLVDFPARLVFETGQVDRAGARFNDVNAALRAVGESPAAWALVLLDMQFDSGPVSADGLPDGGVGDERFGLQIESALLARWPDLPIVRFTSAHERALQDNSASLARPFLSKLAATSIDLHLALLDHGRLTPAQRRALLRVPADTVVASPALFAVYTEAFRLARVDGHVLMLGESGTGKEHLARYLHAVSSRSAEPFVALNLGGVPSTLIETELFGSVRGAYTDATTRAGRFAQAGGGTLFLDELAAMPADKQAVLLRVLEERRYAAVGADRSIEVGCQVIAASQDWLDDVAVADRLRSDLLARFHHTLRIPPLRERPEDIIAITESQLEDAMRSQQKQGVVLDASVLQRLCRHPLPRNVRDLSSAVARAVAMRPNNSVVRWEHLGLDAPIARNAPDATPPATTSAAAPAAVSRPEFELQSWVERVPLRGALNAIDAMSELCRSRATLRALRHCRHPVSGKVRVLPAMQLLTNNPQLTSMSAKRLLNQVLGHANSRALDLDELTALIDGDLASQEP